MVDEHTILPVFFAGVVFQALLVSRSMACAIGALVVTKNWFSCRFGDLIWARGCGLCTLPRLWKTPKAKVEGEFVELV